MRWSAIGLGLLGIGFAVSVEAAPKKDAVRPQPKRAKATPARAKPPTLTLQATVGPTDAERRLMAQLPSVRTGKMDYGSCGAKPCSSRPAPTVSVPTPTGGPSLSVTPQVGSSMPNNPGRVGVFRPGPTRGVPARVVGGAPSGAGVIRQAPCRFSR